MSKNKCVNIICCVTQGKMPRKRGDSSMDRGIGVYPRPISKIRLG